ncbi:MAG: hypothetical protein Ct9H90mP3_7660 [Flammeovirgaceae bacterium]|nr:MAG: hypothetical protein Ct9H90mP3_7660 [Flammeovirgaceae bacterium]
MTLLLNVEEESAPPSIYSWRSFTYTIKLLWNNILETIFGKGLTYSFMQDDLISNSPLGVFYILPQTFIF